MIVKTILRQKIPARRVTYRDAQSYFAIFLDDNNRKAVCQTLHKWRKEIYSEHLMTKRKKQNQK